MLQGLHHLREFIKLKSNTIVTWKSMIAKMKSMGNSISRLRIDNDTVFVCSEFTALYELEGVSVERIVPYAH